MNIQSFLTLYAISLPVFFVIDIIWLGFIASSFYRDRMGELFQINWTASIIFYLIFLVGLTFFATYPNLDKGWQMVLLYGALFGFFTYATYDLTNLATLKDWPLDMVIVDIIWGTVLGGSVAVGTYFIYSWF
jgi:uncharacterized membrane protein